DAAREEAVLRGVRFLLESQKPDGSFEGDLGITGVCLKALAVSGKLPKDHPAVQKAVAYVLKFVKEDGGIYDKMLLNYTTCVSMMALVAVDAEKYAKQIKGATEFIIDDQWDETESVDRKDSRYGGWGYGKHKRPDLSNVQFALDALRAAGVPSTHPVFAKAIIFVSRTQSRSESNEGYFISDDGGGFIYTPFNTGESKAGFVTLPNGKKGLKSSGSMTYAGFKSYIYADLDRNDPRVRGALEWIKRHWTVEENPELGQQGLYYYYMTMAKAMHAWGEPRITDDRGFVHDWRAEITRALLKRQLKEGSWTNDADRWFEGNKPLVTAFVILTLDECRPEEKQHKHDRDDESKDLV
ncbi:MAG: terpene cyclase/mutase family protein, partial [Planctomycetia bacterium]|nr:terpene cyclase/mutase family protein [Planctomycetia bacterium]